MVDLAKEDMKDLRSQFMAMLRMFKFNVGSCGIYDCYLFYFINPGKSREHEQLYFSKNCDCVAYYSLPQLRSMSEIDHLIEHHRDMVQFFVDYGPRMERYHNKNNDVPSALDDDMGVAWQRINMSIENPYLEKFLGINKNAPDNMATRILLSSGKGRQYVSKISADCHVLEYRMNMVREYSWAIPNDESLYAIKDLNMPIIEMGAGKGYWASLLSKIGVKVVAFDEDTDSEINSYITGENFFNVNIGSHEQLLEDKYKNHALMLCWPPYDDPFAWDCLRAYQGNTLIYIGESAGMCTGCDNFHDELNKFWEEVKGIEIPQWYAIYDRLWIYRRKDKE